MKKKGSVVIIKSYFGSKEDKENSLNTRIQEKRPDNTEINIFFVAHVTRLSRTFHFYKFANN